MPGSVINCAWKLLHRVNEPRRSYGVEYGFHSADTKQNFFPSNLLPLVWFYSYDPPLVGVAGPNHTGGLLSILTYDFVHRTHVEVFGFYYPRIFQNWYGDNWITRIYQPHRCDISQLIFITDCAITWLGQFTCAVSVFDSLSTYFYTYEVFKQQRFYWSTLWYRPII